MLVIFLLILIFTQKREGEKTQSKILIIAIFLLCQMALSVLFSDYKRLSYELFTDLLRTVVISFITYSVLTSLKKLSRFLTVWLAYHLYLVMDSLTNFAGVGRFGAASLAQYSFLGDANDFALCLNIALPFALYLMVQSDSKVLKIFYGTALILFVTGIVNSLSRGGFLTLTLSGLFICLHQKRKLVSLGIVIATGIVIYSLAPSEFIERMDTLKTGDAFSEEDTGGHRIEHAIVGLKMIVDHPFVGVGLGRFSAEYGTNYAPDGDTRWRAAHNSYVEIGAETGILSFIIYLYLLYYVFHENYKMRKVLSKEKDGERFLYYSSMAVSSGLFAYCVGTAALSAWHYIHIYLMVALTLVIKKLIVKEHGISA